MSAVVNTLTDPRIERLDVYAVGLRRDIGRLWAAACLGDWSDARARLYWMRRSWRRRSYWNGYLAEPSPMPPGLTRVGRGWTRVGALRSLARRIQKEAA